MDFSSVTARIRDVVKVSDVVSKKVRLSKGGKDFFGLCPFHREKTPSFSVNDDKHFYHCFGCGEHGGALDFVQKTQNLSFVEALKLLATEYNIKIDQESVTQARKELSEKEKILKINALAALWLHKNLYEQSNTDVLDYLKRRELDDKAIKKFNLGYAPANAGELIAYLQEQDFSSDEIVTAGIAKNKDGRYVCRFRKRLMFPICTHEGIIAFGGRVIASDDMPKYLNSPETLLFKKKSSFYLENVALKKAREAGAVFVVEGYTDAISMHSIGIENAVATLGTAVSEEHIKKLWSVVQVPTICMDGDQAGLTAMHRVIALALPLLAPGYSLNFVQLPSGHDPDSLIKTYGALRFKNLIKQTISLSDLIWYVHLNKINISTPENKALLKNTLLEVVSTISHSEIRRFYKSYLMQKVNDLIYNSRFKGKKDAELPVTDFGMLFKSITTLQRYELTLAAILIQHPFLLSETQVTEKAHSIILKTKLLDRVYRDIFESFTEHGVTLTSQGLQDIIRKNISESFFEYLCGKASYFLDTMETKSNSDIMALWLQTFDKYDLELIKEEYRAAVQKQTEEGLAVAVKLKVEIEARERAIKESHS